MHCVSTIFKNLTYNQQPIIKNLNSEPVAVTVPVASHSRQVADCQPRTQSTFLSSGSLTPSGAASISILSASSD